MKKQLFTSLLLLFVAVIFCACNTSSRDSLSASTIEDLVAEELAYDCEDVTYGTIKTGYYELADAAERFTLRKLAAAGVITYKCDRILGSVTVRTGYDWWTGRNTYGRRTKYFYFVDVQLTEEGRDYVVEDIPAPAERIDEDMIQPEVGHYPEFDVPEVEIFEETAADIEHDAPDMEEQTPAPKNEAQTPKEEEVVEVEKTPLEIAREKENSTIYNVLCYRLSVVKARNIELNLTMGTARAEYITESYDVTPFGRVYYQIIDGVRECDEVSLKYFEDKGWVID